MTRRPRVAITSGGFEPAADAASGGKHSPFSAAFLEALAGDAANIDGTMLFHQIRRLMMISAEQTPEYSDVRNAGHDGGGFLFVRKR